MMTSASPTLNVEQEIAKVKTPGLIFQLVLTAAMTLFQVRFKKKWYRGILIQLKSHLSNSPT